MSPAGGLLTAIITVPALSTLTAALVCWPIRDGPLGPRLLIFGLILATGIIAGLPAWVAWLSADADRSGEETTP
ncbi:hypothetical protein [Kitasatospora sp. NPDC047058]|uniref:hypothetical protein n=1 Tax=Kitasatospora sp. NPDC047058 TaxID=3155620 RepID=UPI0033BFF838